MGVMRSAVFAMVLLLIGTHLLAQSNQNTPAEPTGTSAPSAARGKKNPDSRYTCG